MRGDEVRATGTLLGTALDEVAVVARDVHRAVAARVFGLLGPVGLPARVAHDGIAAVAYGSTRIGLRVVPPVAGATAAVLRPQISESVHDTPAGRFAVGAVNGFWGDRLAATLSPIAPVMRMRTHEGPLRRMPANVAHDARADATGRLVVFLHGLCETDLAWRFGARRNWGQSDTTFGSKLRDDDGWTPLYVVFNSGLHVSHNGAEFADHLERLVEAWPVPVREIALVGHSMGGLVARSAAHQAADADLGWVRVLRHVVGLGTPHLGAPLERFVARGTIRMSRLPETRPFAVWLNRRSLGIKDMRHGAVLEADWAGFDPDLCVDDRCTEATLLPGVTYSVAAATLSTGSSGPFAHDLLVQHSSAHGTGPVRRIPFDTDRTFHIPRKHHFDLLGDPQVYATLRRWLTAPAGESSPTTVPSPSAAPGRRHRAEPASAGASATDAERPSSTA